MRLQYKSGTRDALITTALLREFKDAFDGRKNMMKINVTSDY